MHGRVLLLRVRLVLVSPCALCDLSGSCQERVHTQPMPQDSSHFFRLLLHFSSSLHLLVFFFFQIFFFPRLLALTPELLLYILQNSLSLSALGRWHGIEIRKSCRLSGLLLESFSRPTLETMSSESETGDASLSFLFKCFVPSIILSHSDTQRLLWWKSCVFIDIDMTCSCCYYIKESHLCKVKVSNSASPTFYISPILLFSPPSIPVTSNTHCHHLIHLFTPSACSCPPHTLSSHLFSTLPLSTFLSQTVLCRSSSSSSIFSLPVPSQCPLVCNVPGNKSHQAGTQVPWLTLRVCQSGQFATVWWAAWIREQ